MTDIRTTYERAKHSYDPEHEEELRNAIVGAIAETSKVSDVDALVLRTGEAASALLSALALVLALSPAATRSPTAIRKMTDELGKRLRQRVAAAQASAEVQDFVRRAFHGTDVGGHA
jgi:hypothetical protein